MKCELCGADNPRPIELKDCVSGKILQEMQVCKQCRKDYEFVIGAVEWADQN